MVLLSCGGAPEPDPAVRAPVVIEVEAGPDEPVLAAPITTTTNLVRRWEGIGKQHSGPTWKMVLDITSLEPGPCAEVTYPSIPCAGQWVCSGKSDGIVLEANERITEGRGRCHDDVRVIVRLGRGRQSLEFAVEAGKDSARAVLRRSDREP